MIIAARTRCRRCSAKLAQPTENPLSAFCCKGCVRLHYRAKCVICAGRKSGKGLACNHPSCRSELAAKKRHDALGMVWGTGRAKLGSADAAKIGVSEDARPPRGGRQVAGPQLSPKDLCLATLGKPFEQCRKLNRRHWFDAERAEIEASGSFVDTAWREMISPDGVGCFVAVHECAT